MSFKKLMAILIVQRSNFQVLHWKSIGRHFDNMHTNVTNNYYEMVSTDIDDVTECAMRLGVNPVNLVKACQIAASTEGVSMYSTEKDYERDEIVSLTDKSLKSILNAIADVLQEDEIQENIENVGIKAYLEGLYDKYDKEYRFLNRRRMHG